MRCNLIDARPARAWDFRFKVCWLKVVPARIMRPRASVLPRSPAAEATGYHCQAPLGLPPPRPSNLKPETLNLKP